MGEIDIPSSVLDRFSALLSDLTDQLGGRPTLGEFLEILGWTVPVNSSSIAENVALPLKFNVQLTERRGYRSQQRSRTGDLGDYIFVDTTEVLTLLIDSISNSSGQPVTLSDFASHLVLALKASRVSFEDVAGEDIVRIAIITSKRTAKPKAGDVLAIPAKLGGYHMAVIVARNHFGTALGILRGRFKLPLPNAQIHNVIRHPVYTDDRLVAAGVWHVIGHRDDLLALFPRNPEIYHGPDLRVPGVDLGEFGAAESPDGKMRLIEAEEAQQIGLGRSYRQAYMGEQLQQVLDDSINPNSNYSSG